MVVRKSVAVVGGGIAGFSTAVALQKNLPWLDVTILTEKLTPNTTGDGAAGLWIPYLLEDTPDEDIVKWAGKTYRLLRRIFSSRNAGQAGVAMLPVTIVTNEDIPTWKNLVMGFVVLEGEEKNKILRKFDKNYKNVYQFVTFTCEAKLYIPYLMRIFKANGGNTEIKKIENLEKLYENGYDVIINCTGLGARELIGDNNVHPIRGQVIRVSAPWQYEVMLDDDYYIIPNQNSVVLGGTHQLNDWNTIVNENDKENIFKQCCKMVKGLKNVDILTDWVGLRPGRCVVRVEKEERKGSNGKTFQVIHNYGHGGSGITLSWGCANEVVDIFKKMVPDTKETRMLAAAKL